MANENGNRGRGRPKKADEDRVVKRKIGMRPNDWRLVEEASEIRGVSMTEYVRDISVRYAQKLISKRDEEDGI